MKRRLPILVLAVLVLMLTGVAAQWHLTATRLEDGFQAWIAERRAQGWSVRVGSVARGRWSRSVSLLIHDFEISGGEPTIPGGVGWFTPRVTLRVDLFDPWRIGIEPEGLQSLRLPGGRTVSLTAEGVWIGLSGGPERTTLTFDTEGIRAELPDPGGQTETLDIAELDARLEWTGAAATNEVAASFAITGKGIRLPEGTRWPLGRLVETISADGALIGPLPAAAAPRLAALAWRDTGGSLEVNVQALTWGPLTASGSATLALDEQLQPMGAGSAHVSGFQGTFDALGSNGVLTHSAVKAAKALLSLMAGVPSGRETHSVDVPLTLQFRTLSMRQIPLALLPELEWPGP